MDTGLCFSKTRLGVGAQLTRNRLRTGTDSACLINALLYGFRPDDVPTVVVLSVIFPPLAAMACFVADCRASRVDAWVIASGTEVA